MAARSRAAPFPGPVAHGHGGACSVVGIGPGGAERGVAGGGVAPGVAPGGPPPPPPIPGRSRGARNPRAARPPPPPPPRGRAAGGGAAPPGPPPRGAGWAPAALGPDIRRGATPVRTDPSRPIDHFEVRGAIAVVVFDVILELRDRHIVVPIVQQGLPLLLRSVVHDDEPVREGLHRRIAVPLG